MATLHLFVLIIEWLFRLLRFIGIFPVIWSAQQKPRFSVGYFFYSLFIRFCIEFSILQQYFKLFDEDIPDKENLVLHLVKKAGLVATTLSFSLINLYTLVRVNTFKKLLRYALSHKHRFSLQNEMYVAFLISTALTFFGLEMFHKWKVALSRSDPNNYLHSVETFSRSTFEVTFSLLFPSLLHLITQNINYLIYSAVECYRADISEENENRKYRKVKFPNKMKDNCKFIPPESLLMRRDKTSTKDPVKITLNGIVKNLKCTKKLIDRAHDFYNLPVLVLLAAQQIIIVQLIIISGVRIIANPYSYAYKLILFFSRVVQLFTMMNSQHQYTKMVRPRTELYDGNGMNTVLF